METRRSSWNRLLVLLAIGALACGASAVAGLAPASVARAQEDEDRSSGQGFLGVITQDLDESLRDSYDYRGSSGVLVSQVESGSAADRAGLRRGDIILRFDGKRVDSASDLSDLVRRADPGDRVSITVWRAGRERSVSAVVGRRGEGREEREGGEDEEGPVPPTPSMPPAPPEPDEDEVGPTPAPAPRPGDLDERMTFFTVRPRLGVEIQDLNEDLRGYFDVPENRGALVTRVLDDTPARRAGIRAGDVIVELDGRRIDDSDDLRRELARKSAGTVRVTVLRKGERQTLTAQLQRRNQPFVAGRDFEELLRPYRNNGPQSQRELRDQRDELRREMQRMQREMDELRRELEQLRRDRRNEP